MTSQGGPLGRPWRTGRKVGRTVYCMLGDEPSDDDVLIGLMDSIVLADEVVRAHNHLLLIQERPW